MRLYMARLATTCRGILMWMAENGVTMELVPVDIMTGANHDAAYRVVNPNAQVPTLQDGDFILTESIAILFHLAQLHGTPDLPTDLRARARVHAAIDWCTSSLYRDLGYGMVYPQVLPHYAVGDAGCQLAHLKWSADRTRERLRVLDSHMLGDGRAFICGDAITLADYIISTYVTLGDLIGYDFTPYRNLTAWLDRIRSRESWRQTDGDFREWVRSLEGRTFILP